MLRRESGSAVGDPKGSAASSAEGAAGAGHGRGDRWGRPFEDGVTRYPLMIAIASSRYASIT
jgi:hypothetical protein